MIVVRLADGIKEHFPARASEWALALILVNWGYVLLLPGDSFIRSGNTLGSFMTESMWGWACLFMGFSRLIALFVNGTFKGFRHSPHVRAIMSFLSCGFWFMITIGLMQTSSTGLAVYPVLLLLDYYNAARASRDARLVDEAARQHVAATG